MYEFGAFLRLGVMIFMVSMVKQSIWKGEVETRFGKFWVEVEKLVMER